MDTLTRALLKSFGSEKNKKKSESVIDTALIEELEHYLSLKPDYYKIISKFRDDLEQSINSSYENNNVFIGSGGSTLYNMDSDFDDSDFTDSYFDEPNIYSLDAHFDGYYDTDGFDLRDVYEINENDDDDIHDSNADIINPNLSLDDLIEDIDKIYRQHGITYDKESYEERKISVKDTLKTYYFGYNNNNNDNDDDDTPTDIDDSKNKDRYASDYPEFDPFYKHFDECEFTDTSLPHISITLNTESGPKTFIITECFNLNNYEKSSILKELNLQLTKPKEDIEENLKIRNLVREEISRNLNYIKECYASFKEQRPNNLRPDNMIDEEKYNLWKNNVYKLTTLNKEAKLKLRHVIFFLHKYFRWYYKSIDKYLDTPKVRNYKKTKKDNDVSQICKDEDVAQRYYDSFGKKAFEIELRRIRINEKKRTTLFIDLKPGSLDKEFNKIYEVCKEQKTINKVMVYMIINSLFRKNKKIYDYIF